MNHRSSGTDPLISLTCSLSRDPLLLMRMTKQTSANHSLLVSLGSLVSPRNSSILLDRALVCKARWQLGGAVRIRAPDNEGISVKSCWLCSARKSLRGSPIRLGPSPLMLFFPTAYKSVAFVRHSNFFKISRYLYNKNKKNLHTFIASKGCFQ